MTASTSPSPTGAATAVIESVHVPRWGRWEALRTPTLAVFADHGMFTVEAKDELVCRRPTTRRADLAGAGHDAHLDAFDDWIAVLRDELDQDVEGAATLDGQQPVARDHAETGRAGRRVGERSPSTSPEFVPIGRRRTRPTARQPYCREQTPRPEEHP
ncbi:hypothetical protein UQW22_16990 [Isoptericola halotolerans]|uniref:alpha/beta fold hydrolase n=1 Tax=Isoptericola halotolerans TaxID=300560 RepID=UPI00388D0B2D